MSNLVQRHGSTFVVDFGEVELPLALAKDLDSEMQALALRTLARTGRRGPFFFGRLPPGVWGMIFSDGLPDWLKGEPDDKPSGLGVDDHTIIVDAGMRHALALTRIFAADRKAGRKISGDAVLTALSRLPSLDERARRSIAAVLKHAHHGARDVSIDSKAKHVVRGIEEQIDACDDLDELEKLLGKLGREHAGSPIEGLTVGLETALGILRAGRSTIYSPDHEFYEVSNGGNGTTAVAKAATSRVGKADTKGAITGAVAGGAVGGLAGGAMGAVLGSCTGSLLEVLSAIWELFD